METILMLIIIYYLIGTIILCNFLFNSNLDLTVINTKTGEQRKPTNKFLLFYSLLWIFFIPLSIYEKREE
jgi:hypothetical protein